MRFSLSYNKRTDPSREFTYYIRMDVKSLHQVAYRCKSIYFFDPNGHRLELAVDTTTPEMAKDLSQVSQAMMEEWTRTKKAPHHADWVHKK